MDVDLVLDAGAELGEGPTWDERSGRLVWVDILGSKVHLFDPSSGRDQVFDVGQHVGAAVPRVAGGLVLALRGGFGTLDLASGTVEQIADTEMDEPDNRMNDGKCDSEGRFWAGSMAYSETGTAGVAPGSASSCARRRSRTARKHSKHSVWSRSALTRPRNRNRALRSAHPWHM